jgi:serine/threonine-protein kinase
MVGQNIGKYRVLERIGRGGMGTVYRAIDETLHREVAIKVLNAELNDPEVAKRFRAEAITVARLSHPGIATIYELFQHEGQWLMVMEFVRGETLERMAERLGSLSPQRTAELCMQALAALAHAHSMGVVHRDLKPANMMITETGTVKIMDFGIARVAGTEHLTSAGFMMGTPAYMAPEQVMGHEIDARADLYAMGVVYYRMTSGKLPFKGDTPFAMAQSQVNEPPTPIGTHRGDLPPWVEQLLVRALAKNPEERFQSAVEFHEAFARCLAGLPMATLYSSSAPTELMMTPPRAMPTAAMQRPLTPVSLPPLTGGPQTDRSPASTPAPPAAAPSPPPSAATAAHAPAARASDGLAPSAPARTAAGPTRVPASLIAAAAAALVVVAVGAWLMLRPSAPVPEATETAAAPVVEAPAPAPDPPPPAPAPATPAPAAPPVAAPPKPAAEASSTAASSSGGVDGAAPSAAGGRATPPAAVAGGRASAAATKARGPVFDDTPIEVRQVKLLHVAGRRTKDQDVVLNFGNGAMAMVGRDDRITVAALPYQAVQRVTYVHARDPRWDATLVAPPEDLDVGGIFRTAKHWMVFQAHDAYVILRLEDENWRQVYDTVATRTGLQIVTPSPEKR